MPPRNLTGGAALYDALYAAGYHTPREPHHAHLLLSDLNKRVRQDRPCGAPVAPGARPQGRSLVCSVLDVGCSHGAAVAELWRAGFRANGVDVSAFAIESANRTKLGHPRQRCAARPCFQASPATRLPFGAAAFDVVLSSDVLEHLEPDDVPQAVGEITRVARHLAFLKISNRAESGGKELSALRQRGSEVPTQLHTTVRGPDFWLDHFEAHGWVVHHMLEAEDEPMANGLPWECCSYVLHPAAAPGARQRARAYRRRMEAQPWFRKANVCLHWKKRQC